MLYKLNGRTIDIETPDGSAALEAVHRSKGRLQCICSSNHPQMYVARAGGELIVKRMPTTGHLHHPDCKSFMPPEELSGLSQILATAVDESPEDGTTYLKLGFPLATKGKATMPPPEQGERASETAPPEHKLTLTGLLHYLWHDADLVKWTPRMAGQRWWGVIHNALQQSVVGKDTNGKPLGPRVFIPVPFKPENKETIAASRNAFFREMSKSTKATTPLGILIAEYKTHEPARFGSRFIFKHMPDCGFFADEALVKRFNKVFEEDLQLADMVPGSHFVMIATFSIAKAGYPLLHQIGGMLTTENWIPFENLREVALLDALTNQDRQFARSMRFNLPRSSPIATLILTDVKPLTACFMSGPTDDTAQINRLIEVAKDGKYPAWIWTDEPTMPNLPDQTRAVKSMDENRVENI